MPVIEEAETMKALMVVMVLGIGGSLAACSSGGDVPGRQQQPQQQRTGTASSAIDSCEHAICTTGTPLVSTCDTCPTTLCARDPYCCTTAWDATCVGEVTSICGLSCSAPPPPTDGGTSTCTHPICASGGPLVSGCEPCAGTLCAQDPYCCTTAWDGTCVNEVASVCGLTCN